MKILVIGATGVIGSAVADALSSRHEVLRASRRAALPVDLDDPSTIRPLFEAAGALDAVVCCAGNARFGELDQLTDDDFAFSIRSKLMGQVAVIREARTRVRDGGSITVTTGVLATSPIPGSAAISLVNAGLEGFARAAALEATRGVRINVVSPPWMKETLRAMGRDDAPGTAAAEFARVYVEAVEGTANGQVLGSR